MSHKVRNIINHKANVASVFFIFSTFQALMSGNSSKESNMPNPSFSRLLRDQMQRLARLRCSVILVVIAVTGVVLTGCAPYRMPATGLSDPSPHHFAYCRDHTCETILKISLLDGQWSEITAPLQTPADNPSAERVQLSHVIATYETIVAEKAGTSRDIGGTIKGVFRLGQLDCIDETVNTDTLLVMLSRENLLRWHRRGDRAQRFVFFSDGAPHFAATIVEQPTGEVFAVDSWFRDNGQPADVVALADWQAGWNPE
jgi:hypothetical protein